jgi:uncharacterized protein
MRIIELRSRPTLNNRGRVMDSNQEMSGVMQERKMEGKSKEILLKALNLRSIEDIPKIQEDVANKTIIILKVTPLAQKSLEELKSSVEQLYEYATSVGGDIARLGDERVVITPPGVKIWRGLQ